MDKIEPIMTVLLKGKNMDQRLYKKDEIIYVKIEDMTTTGEGVGKDHGFTIFVDGALPGEKVKAKIMKIKKVMLLDH